ncbi:MAG: zinc-ribbon domain-containing protein [Acidobacteriota bacterium]
MESADAKVLVTCPSCASQFRASAAKISPQGSRVRCPKCTVMFLLRLDGGTAVASALPGAAAPQASPQATPAAPAAGASAPGPAPTAMAPEQPPRAPVATLAAPAPAAAATTPATAASKPATEKPAEPTARPAARPAPLPLSAPAQRRFDALEPMVDGAQGLVPARIEDVQTLSLAPRPEEEAARLAEASQVPARATPASAGEPGETRWQIDMPEHLGQTFSMAELKTMVRDGALLQHDPVTKAGEESWAAAGEVPEIRRLFELKEMMDRKKADKPQKASAPVSVQHPCANHPQWEAELRCSKCGKYFCIHCVDQKRAGSASFYSCKTCHDLCKQVDKTYAITPFYLMLPQLFASPWKGWGPLMMVLNAGMLWVSTWPIPVPFASFLCKAIVLAYLLWILKYAARGRETVPDWPDTSDVLELAGIGVRASTVTLISFAPLLIFLTIFFWPMISGMLGMGMPSPTEVTPLPIPSQMESERPAEPSQYHPVMPEGGVPYAAAPPEVSVPYAAAPPEGGGLEPPDTAWVEQMAVQRGGGTKEDMSVDARQQMEERLAREREAADREAQEELESRMGGVMAKGVIFFIGVTIGSLFAFVYYPMSLAVTAVWHVLRPILNPLFIFRLIGRIAGQYVAFLIFFGIFTFVGWMSQALFSRIPIAGSLLYSSIQVYIYFVTSFMLGRLCYSNDARLGWEEEIYPGR